MPRRGSTKALAVLASSHLFRRVDSGALVQAREAAEPVRLRPGQVLITEGQLSDGLYLVVRGRLRVSITSPTSEVSPPDIAVTSSAAEPAVRRDTGAGVTRYSRPPKNAWRSASSSASNDLSGRSTGTQSER